MLPHMNLPMIVLRPPSLWREEWNPSLRLQRGKHGAKCLCPICQDKRAAAIASRRTTRRGDRP